MAEENRNERDLILAPNEYALVSDATKGSIDCYIGPFKTSLAGTDRCVLFDNKSKRFRPTSMQEGTQLFQTAPEGFYIVLKNPAVGGKHPTAAGKQSTPDLCVGKKVNIAGPASFPLWPGQMSKVIKGHNLRSNEYLLVRVYDEEAAQTNFKNAVIKTTDGADAPAGDLIKTANLTMGQLLIIKGTEVSFYIPSTGLEVVPEHVGGEDRYVREAVTLERLEYCLLLDQNGSKRYEEGPAVVFPRPTEKFVEQPIKSDPEKAKAKKFRAVELSETSGIHVKVTTDYTAKNKDGKDVEYHTGDELFITGKDQMIYFPRDEHALIKYGNQDIHYGIAIPAGEARYVLNRTQGTIRLEKGPSVFLPDPRTEVIVKRALALSLVELLYPGNSAALEHNMKLLGEDNRDTFGGASGAHEALRTMNNDLSYGAVAAVAPVDTDRKVMIRGASKAVAGDSFDRKNKYTEPRTVVLNTRYDGAVSIDVWTGFAVKLVRKDGSKRVVVGPTTAMLEYDEQPQILTLSRGKPKNSDNPLKTVYLRVTNNRVGDIIEVETKDFVKVNVSLSYRLNFEGPEADRWFEVEDYVKYLCDNMRSRIRSQVRKLGIEEFYANSESIIRDIVLGASPGEGKPRPGTTFEENALHVYDAEILAVKILAADIEQMLVKSQRDAVQQSLQMAQEQRKLGFINAVEDIKRQTELATAETRKQARAIQASDIQQALAVDLATIMADGKRQDERQALAEDATIHHSKLNELALAQKRAEAEVVNDIETKKAAIARGKIEAEVAAVVEKAKAITPEFIAALQAFGDKALIEKVAQSMAPMAILGVGEHGVLGAMGELLKGTGLGDTLAKAAGAIQAKQPRA